MTFLQTDLRDAMLDGMAGLVVREEDGEILCATPLLEDMFGYTMRGELSTGMVVEDLIPISKREVHKNVHRLAYRQNPIQRAMGKGLVLEGQRKDGSVFPVAVTLRGRVISGVRCIVASVMDMTDWGPKHSTAPVGDQSGQYHGDWARPGGADPCT